MTTATVPSQGIRLPQVLRSVYATRLAVLALLAVVFSILEPQFLAPESLAVLVKSMAFVGIVAAGQTVLIIAGEFDLSVGAVAGTSGIICALLMTSAGVPPLAAVGLVLVLGAGVGLLNGTLAVRARIPSFIVTLGMLYVARSFGSFLTGGRPVYPLPDAVNAFGSLNPLGLSVAVWVMVMVMIAAELVLRFTTAGRVVFAVGGNIETARLLGVKPERVKTAAFMVVGVLAATAGMLSMAQFGTAQQTTGTGWELLAIAAIVIGGSSLFGGSGSVIGTFLGVLLLQVVSAGLVAAGIDLWWQTVAIGVVMIGSMALDRLRGRLGG